MASDSCSMGNVSKLVDGGISAGLKSTAVADYHYSAYTTDNKLYFVSRKGVNQQKYSFFHRTTLMGGYVLCLNLDTNKFDEPVNFDVIDSDENREDLIFGLGVNLYNLVYSRYDGFQYRQLLVWKENKWQNVDIKIDPQTKNDVGHRFHLAQPAIISEENAVYLVAFGEDNGVLEVAKLNIAHNNNYISSEGRAVIMKPPGWCIQAHVQNGILYCLMGSQGCGFRWEPGQLISASLMDVKGTIKTVNVDANQPMWAYSGARNAFRMGVGHKSRWVFIGGSIAEGMAQTKPCDQIWQIQFDDKGLNPSWEKIGASVANPLDSEGACYTNNRINHIFIADAKNGVYRVRV